MGWTKHLHDRAAGIVCGAALVLAASCESPTLPLPPPTAPSVTADADPNYVQLDGYATAYALVLVFNENTGSGVIATASPTGIYHARIQVDFVTYPQGNRMEVWERDGTIDSTITGFNVLPPAR